MLEQIIEREELGRSLAFTRVPGRLRGAAHYYFGSWCSAIEAAGLDYDAVRLLRVPYTRAALARELRALRKEQPAMTLAELHRHGLAEPCLREFASLEAAARSAGLERWPVRRLRTLLGK